MNKHLHCICIMIIESLLYIPHCILLSLYMNFAGSVLQAYTYNNYCIFATISVPVTHFLKLHISIYSYLIHLFTSLLYSQFNYTGIGSVFILVLFYHFCTTVTGKKVYLILLKNAGYTSLAPHGNVPYKNQSKTQQTITII